jgi:hypothetical protein
MARDDKGRSRHYRRALRLVRKAAEAGQQVGYYDMPGGAFRICTTDSLKRALAFWGPLLAEPITPENPLHLDYRTKRAWRGHDNGAQSKATRVAGGED